MDVRSSVLSSITKTLKTGSVATLCPIRCWLGCGWVTIGATAPCLPEACVVSLALCDAITYSGHLRHCEGPDRDEDVHKFQYDGTGRFPAVLNAFCERRYCFQYGICISLCVLQMVMPVLNKVRFR